MRWQRPLNYITIIPLAFAVGAAVTLLSAGLAALGVPLNMVRSLLLPTAAFAMIGFLIWARTGKDGQFVFWPK